MVRPVPIERWAAHWTLGLIALALFIRPSGSVAHKAVLVCVAALIANRIYSPQFNLWFYPFLLWIALESPRRRMWWLFGLYGALELSNVMVYPFAFTEALLELGRFGPYVARERGGAWTVFWSICVVVRALVLLVLAAEMLRRAPAEASTERASLRWRAAAANSG